MSPAQVNARIILPVTTCDTIMKGHRVDMVLYANNYEQVDDDHPIIERFGDMDRAFSVFREGMVMSKGTTTSTGIVHSYFANIFGPPQYRDIHDRLAMVFFNAFSTGGCSWDRCARGWESPVTKCGVRKKRPAGCCGWSVARADGKRTRPLRGGGNFSIAFFIRYIALWM